MNQMKAGALLSYLSLLVTILIALLYTPVMIRQLGQSEFGLYALIGSFAAYFSILDMGLGNAIVRYISRNRAIGDKEEESRLNGMFFILYSVFGLFTLLVGLILLSQLDAIFGTGLTAAEIEKARIMVIILMINIALSFPLAIFGSVLQAYERFIVVKLVSLARTVLVPVIALPLLFLGFGSVAMVVITSAVNLFCLLLNGYFCYKHIKIRFYFGKIDASLLKEILGYSSFVFLGIIVDQIYWSTDQFILGLVSGTVPVAIYAIAIQFIRIYIQFSTSISGVFFPRVSMMVANQASHAELTGVMVKYGRLQYIMMAYILGGFILFGRPFIHLWAGEDYSQAYEIVLCIMIPLSFPLIQNVGIAILYAKNLQGFRSVMLMIIALFKVIISIPLAEHYGGIGAAAATAASLIIGNIMIMNIYYHRKIGVNMVLFWKNISVLSIPALSAILAGWGIHFLLPPNSLMFLFYKMLLFSVLFVYLMWLFGWNAYEKGLCFSALNGLKRMVPKPGMKWHDYSIRK